MGEVVDAVVVGAGHNGLVAAAVLADAGWDVLVLEAGDTIGGAVRSARPWPDRPDAVVDLFSAFYPLAKASPVLARLELERHGLEWVTPAHVLAHVADPGEDDAPVIHLDPEATAAGFEAAHPGDGQTWLDLLAQWRTLREDMLWALFTAFPPVAPLTRLLARAGVGDALRLARTAVLPVTRLGEELFGGDGPRRLLAGNAMHADVPMIAPGSGLFGWLLSMLAQDVGYPVPRGGAGMLSQAIGRRAEAAGARIETGERVERVLVGGGRAMGVRTASGRLVRARRGVFADVAAPALFHDLVGEEHLPARLRSDLLRFEWDLPTVKLNWLVEGGIGWRAHSARTAGTVHVGTGVPGLCRWSSALASGTHPEETFALFGQMTTSDPTRSAPGTESAWAYTHLPRGATKADADRLVEQVEATMEAFAPGFHGRVVDRLVQLPGDLQGADANLVGGAINAGTAQLHQQLVFRPASGLGRPETPIQGLYLAGASAHPGGGVHGACGWIAARSALRAAQPVIGPARRAVVRGAQALVYRDAAGPAGASLGGVAPSPIREGEGARTLG
ncbi:MAG: NAD(P)/FAD-dependent oxidoreductase [Kineosporiaceae bacterium]